MKVLIIHPEFKDPGGVSNYFTALKGRFEVETGNFMAGKRAKEKNFISSILRLVRDYTRFIKVLKNDRYNIVHINPSFNFKSTVRDGVFIIIAKQYKKRVIVFFRGWNEHFEKMLEPKTLWVFQFVYKKVNAFIVLADKFKNKLRMWGFEQPVYLATTTVDDDVLKDFDIKEAVKNRKNSTEYKILFLSRLVRKKGVYETIDAVNLLRNNFSNIRLVVAGDGPELPNIKNYVKKNDISNVVFSGYVRGRAKRRLFEDSYLYCFPTYYEEGMPNSLLEAMAFGLPIITRPVGGIADFFETGRHGFMDESKDPSVFGSYIEKLLLDEKLYEKISLYNYKYAQERFLASKVAQRLEKIYTEVLQQ